MDSIGFGSMPIVVLTGFFTGCVLALQSATSLQEFGAVSMTGNLVALSMVKELGPVLTGLMVSGRNASGMASELGSMKVTEQIDAMRALGTDPMRKLVTPRLYATIFMLFFLTILADAFGIAGGALVSIGLLGLNASSYFHNSYRALAYAGCCPGDDQAALLRFYHRHRRLLFRHEHEGRNAGRRSLYDAGRGGLFCVYHHRRLDRYACDDRHLRQVIGDHARPYHQRRFSRTARPRCWRARGCRLTMSRLASTRSRC